MRNDVSRHASPSFGHSARHGRWPQRCAVLLVALAPLLPGAGAGSLAAPLDANAPLLRAEQAFALSTLQHDGRIVARWRMPPGYYLYRDKLRIEADGARIGTLEAPAGESLVDQFFGATEVYYGEVEISARVLSQGDGPLHARIHYQGCAAGRLCYPPQVQRVRFEPGGGPGRAARPAAPTQDAARRTDAPGPPTGQRRP